MPLKSSQTEIRIFIGDQTWNSGSRGSVSERFQFRRQSSVSEQLTEASGRRWGDLSSAKKSAMTSRAGQFSKARVPLAPGEAPPETEDWITSRILWLDGIDPENLNTRDRYIYIHGTKHEDTVGVPDSYGCVRMRNDDVIELFRLVEEGTPVTIEE